MYHPFSEALNYALERLSEIQVDGLPEFKSHIAFVPCNKGVKSDTQSHGYLVKPDIALMSIRGACEFYELDQLDVPNISQFISKIAGNPPSGSTNWKTILSAIEVKRKSDVSGWASLPEAFVQQSRQVSVVQDADKGLDETLDGSQPTTRKISLLSYDHTLKGLDSGLICDLGVLKAVRGCGGDGSWRRGLRQQTTTLGEGQDDYTDPCYPKRDVCGVEVLGFILY